MFILMTTRNEYIYVRLTQDYYPLYCNIKRAKYLMQEVYNVYQGKYQAYASPTYIHHCDDISKLVTPRIMTKDDWDEIIIYFPLNKYSLSIKEIEKFINFIIIDFSPMIERYKINEILIYTALLIFSWTALNSHGNLSNIYYWTSFDINTTDAPLKFAKEIDTNSIYTIRDVCGIDLIVVSFSNIDASIVFKLKYSHPECLNVTHIKYGVIV